MKKILTLILGFVFAFTFAQKSVTFPYKVKLTNSNGDKVSSKTFSNNNNPFVVVFIEPLKLINVERQNKNHLPTASFFNELDATISKWEKEYKTKTIVVFHLKKDQEKKIDQLIKSKNWGFTYYFNSNKKLYKKITGTSLINLQAISIFDGEFNAVFNSNLKPKYERIYCKDREGNFNEYYMDKNNNIVEQNGLLKESEEILDLIQLKKQNKDGRNN